MKTVASIVALIVAFGFAGTREASADFISGRVLQVSAGASDSLFTGSVFGKRADNTYWIVYTTSSIPASSTGRLLTAAGANHGLNQITVWSVDSGGTGSYLYYAGPYTWIGMTNSY